MIRSLPHGVNGVAEGRGGRGGGGGVRERKKGGGELGQYVVNDTTKDTHCLRGPVEQCGDGGSGARWRWGLRPGGAGGGWGVGRGSVEQEGGRGYGRAHCGGMGEGADGLCVQKGTVLLQDNCQRAREYHILFVGVFRNERCDCSPVMTVKPVDVLRNKRRQCSPIRQ